MTQPIKTVYSWYMPEIYDFVKSYAKHDYPSDTFKQNYDPGLDNLHEPLMDAFWDASMSDIWEGGYAYDDMKHHYYCNGSSEALFHLLARHKTHFPNVPLYQFAGEYQGYQGYAEALGLNFMDIEHGIDTSALKPGVFFISVPSAVDGNAVDPSVLEKIARCHYMVIDCAYAGMGPQPQIPSHLSNRVTAIVASMSKPFGLYYHRIGFLWSRDPVPSLYGNKWFKNAFSIEMAHDLLTGDFGWTAQELQLHYRSWQERACKEASEAMGMTVNPSDVWLLGHAYPGTESAVSYAAGEFQRGPAYRFCLTPYYMEYANERS